MRGNVCGTAIGVVYLAQRYNALISPSPPSKHAQHPQHPKAKERDQRGQVLHQGVNKVRDTHTSYMIQENTDFSLPRTSWGDDVCSAQLHTARGPSTPVNYGTLPQPGINGNTYAKYYSTCCKVKRGEIHIVLRV